MKITDKGQICATMQELLNLHMKHFFSTADTEPQNISPKRRCGTATTLTGYTEWIGADTHLAVSIGWDWRIDVHDHNAVLWWRNDLPRTNIQLLDGEGKILTWEDNLRILATWVDALPWAIDVAHALTPPAPT